MSSISNAATGSAVKRYACDRCRDLKLRCPRELPTDESCARCVRACAMCVTSSTRPLGRPRVSDINGRATKAPRHQAAGAGMLHQGPWQGPNQGEHQRTHLTSSLDCRSPTPRISLADSPAWSRGTGLDEFSDFFGSGSAQSAPAEGADSISSGPGWMQFDVAELFGLQIPGTAKEADVTHPQAATEPISQPLEGQNQHITVSNQGVLMDFESFAHTSPALLPDAGVDDERGAVSSAVADPRVRLCQLNESLIHQLGRVESSSWRPPLVQSSCIAKINSTDENPLAQIMQSTSDMAVILQQLFAFPTGPGINHNGPEHSTAQPGTTLPVLATSTPAASSGDHELDASTVLLALSTWLRLIQLYNTLFTRVHASLRELPRHAIIAFQGPVNLRVPGLPGVQGDLYVKLMIQVIKHHLEKVEVLLGLPDEFCMWKRSGTPSPGAACLWNQRFSGLLPMVMKQMADSGGKTTLRSLADSISAVQDILQTP
jgi:hypothetical protein